MKNQYFGDTRDLFKYDLALRIMEGIPSIRSFTFIPMLTTDDRSSDGSRINHRKARAGNRNTALVHYLEGCVLEGRRDIGEILPFFGERGIPVHLFGEDFAHGERSGYFRSIPDTWLRDALVFLDPDIGLQVARPTEKHLLFSELEALSSRMGETAVLMVFQYIPRIRRAPYLERRMGELERIIPGGTLAISDNQVTFFFLVRDPGIRRKVKGILTRYREDYPCLTLSP